MSEDNVKKALAYLNKNFLAERNVRLWYAQFYDEITKRDLLYRWYILHTAENLHEQVVLRDEIIAKQITQCIEQQKNAGGWRFGEGKKKCPE